MTAWIAPTLSVISFLLPHLNVIVFVSKPLLGDHPILVLGGAILSLVVVRFLWRRRTTQWPVTQGRIETVKVSTIRSYRGGPSERSTAEISYSYSVAGQFHSGYWTKHFSDEQEAWDFVDPLKEQKVAVHYHPRHPEKSALADLMV
jgi:uncharacterized protein DUF3592